MLTSPKIKQSVLEAWEAIVRQLNPLTSPILPLPKEPRGRYVKYAYAADGSLALPRGRGRRLRPHRNLRKLQRQQDLAHLAQKLFMGAVQSRFNAEQAIAAETSPFTMSPLTMDSMNEMKAWAVMKSHEIIQTKENDLSNAARHRRAVSRRINFGILSGDHNKAAHSGA
jgi:hypothetical protein